MRHALLSTSSFIVVFQKTFSAEARKQFSLLAQGVLNICFISKSVSGIYEVTLGLADGRSISDILCERFIFLFAACNEQWGESLGMIDVFLVLRMRVIFVRFRGFWLNRFIRNRFGNNIGKYHIDPPAV